MCNYNESMMTIAFPKHVGSVTLYLIYAISYSYMLHILIIILKFHPIVYTNRKRKLASIRLLL